MYGRPLPLSRTSLQLSLHHRPFSAERAASAWPSAKHDENKSLANLVSQKKRYWHVYRRQKKKDPHKNEGHRLRTALLPPKKKTSGERNEVFFFNQHAYVDALKGDYSWCLIKKKENRKRQKELRTIAAFLFCSDIASYAFTGRFIEWGQKLRHIYVYVYRLLGRCSCCTFLFLMKRMNK